MVSPQVPKRSLNNTQKVLLDAINGAIASKAVTDLGMLCYIIGYIKKSEPEIADMLRLMIKKPLPTEPARW